MEKIIIILSILIICSLPLYSNPNENKEIEKLLLRGKYHEVIALLEQKQSEGLELSAEEYFNLGLSYQRLLNSSKALKVLLEANRIESQNPAYQMALANAFLRTGQKLFALGIYRDVVNIDSGNVGAWIEIGNILLEQGNNIEAEAVYNYLIRLDPSNDYFFRQLGYCQYKQKKKEDAIKSYIRSLEIDSLNTSSLLQLSKIYFKYEDYEKAYDLIRRGLSASAFNLPLNRLGAEVLFKMQLYEMAAVQYTLLIDAGDTNSAVYQKLGFCNYFAAEKLYAIDSSAGRNKMLEAVYALEESRRLEWENPLTSLYLGICFKELEEYGKAITYLEETLNLLYPDYISDVYIHLGAAYEKERKYQESITAYQEALGYNPSNNSILFQLAAVYDQYYADREVPLIYYRLFVNRGGDENPILKNYAQSRISSLIEELHFRNGRRK